MERWKGVQKSQDGCEQGGSIIRRQKLKCTMSSKACGCLTFQFLLFLPGGSKVPIKRLKGFVQDVLVIVFFFSKGKDVYIGLETVDLDILLVDSKTIFGGDEIVDLGALVSLQLDDLAEGFVGSDTAVAGKIFSEGFQNTFRIEIGGKALYSRQCLTTIALLDTNMNIVAFVCS